MKGIVEQIERGLEIIKEETGEDPNKLIEDMKEQDTEEQDYIDIIIPKKSEEVEQKEAALTQLLVHHGINFDSGYLLADTPAKSQWKLDWSFSAPEGITRKDIINLLDLVGLEYEIERRERIMKYRISFEREIEANSKEEAIRKLDQELAYENTKIWNELEVSELPSTRKERDFINELEKLIRKTVNGELREKAIESIRDSMGPFVLE